MVYERPFHAAHVVVQVDPQWIRLQQRLETLDQTWAMVHELAHCLLALPFIASCVHALA